MEYVGIKAPELSQGKFHVIHIKLQAQLLLQDLPIMLQRIASGTQQDRFIILLIALKGYLCRKISLSLILQRFIAEDL